MSGVTWLSQATEETDEFLPRVFAVAFTDSVHSLQFADNVSDNVKEFFTQVTLTTTHCHVAVRLPSFSALKRNLETEMFDFPYSKREHSA